MRDGEPRRPLRVRKYGPDCRTEKVPIPHWDCCAPDVAVACSECGNIFCPCADHCERCGSETVWRDSRWDIEGDVETLADFKKEAGF